MGCQAARPLSLYFHLSWVGKGAGQKARVGCQVLGSRLGHLSGWEGRCPEGLPRASGNAPHFLPMCHFAQTSDCWPHLLPLTRRKGSSKSCSASFWVRQDHPKGCSLARNTEPERGKEEIGAYPLYILHGVITVLGTQLLPPKYSSY